MTTTRPAAALLAAAALSAALAGCTAPATGHPTPSPGGGPVSAPEAPRFDADVATEDIAGVAIHGAAATLSWRPGPDSNESAAADRARAWLTDDLADRLTTAIDAAPATAQWDDWARNYVTVDAHCDVAAVTVETPRTAAVDLHCTQIAVSPAGDSLSGREHQGRAIVTADGPGVRVTALSLLPDGVWSA